MTVYNSLSEAMDGLKATLVQLQGTLADVRTMVSNEPTERDDYTFTARMQSNVALANEILKSQGFAEESDSKLSQWGVLNATTEKEVRKIIDEVIEYRTQDHCE